jgi:hypothetical protein
VVSFLAERIIREAQARRSEKGSRVQIRFCSEAALESQDADAIGCAHGPQDGDRFNALLTIDGSIFITAFESDEGYCPQIMTDLIYISIIVLFFVVSGWYVRFCEKL